MSLDSFKTAFINTYQEFFPKVLVAMKIANTRLQSDLTYGATVERIKYDISAVDVQDITLHTDMTIDSITDTSETLTVSNWKGAAFPLSEKEKVQAGPLNPGSVIGGQVAIKLATYVDADVLYETVNAELDFDEGDLTTLVSTGTPITLNSTTVPQMVSRMPAKLRRNNQMLQNMCFVIDSYGLSDMFQYLLGKNADFVNALFQNGYVNEQVASAEVYVSENLTAQATLTDTSTYSDGETVVVNGVTFTMKTALTPTAGEVLIGADADASRLNLTAAINASAGAGTTYVELSAANRRLITRTYRITAVNSASANTMVITGKGSGRLTVSETCTNAAWSKNLIHAYFGKKGAIDVVVQKEVNVEMRPEPKQPTDNVISRILYGIKTFTDGSKKFLDVLIAA